MKEISYEASEETKKLKGTAAQKTRSVGNEKVHTVRTFKADVNAHITEKKITRTQIAIAEEEARIKRGESPIFSRKNLEASKFPLIAGIILLLTSGYLLVSSGLTGNLLKHSGRTPVASSETQGTPILLKALTGEAAAAGVGGAALVNAVPQGTILSLSLSYQFGTTTRAITSTEFLSAIGGVPDEIARSVEPAFDLGLASVGETKAYLLFTTTFYENTAVGMLRWEKRIPEDLYRLLDPVRGAQTAQIPAGEWKNRLWGSYAFRAYETAGGEIVLLYGWVNKSGLIITSSIQAFDVIARSMSK